MNNLVSVIMSTYNEPLDMIKSSINSILGQTYLHIEFIIINDNPDRNELDVLLAEFKEKNGNITYIKNNQNLGLVASLNKGIQYCHGEYIARMDADDISDPKRIEYQIKALNDNNLDFVGGSVIKIDENENILGELSVPKDHNAILRKIKYGNCLPHPTWCLKKRVYIELSGYRDVYACEDYDFILRAISKGFKFGNVSTPVLKYRIRKDSVSVSNESYQRITRYFLSKNMEREPFVSVEEIYNYITSDACSKELATLCNYVDTKNGFRQNITLIDKLPFLLRMFSNKYFYKTLFEKIMMGLP